MFAIVATSVAWVRLAAEGSLPRDQGSVGYATGQGPPQSHDVGTSPRHACLSIHVQRAHRLAERYAPYGLGEQLGYAELPDPGTGARVVAQRYRVRDHQLVE